MTKEAQLPDGTILEFPDDAPDSVIDAAVKRHILQSRPLAERYAAAGIVPNEYNPTDGNSFIENALLGYGRAGMQTARGVGQLLGVVDKADVDEARRLDAPLMDTAGGKVGNFAGQVHQMMAMPGVGAGRLARLFAKEIENLLGLGSGAEKRLFVILRSLIQWPI